MISPEVFSALFFIDWNIIGFFLTLALQVSCVRLPCMVGNRRITKRTELQRLLSKRGFASRSKASALIAQGKVSVNGKIVRDPRAYVSIASKLVVVGAELKSLEKNQKILISFHKPAGIVTTSSDEKGRKTVYDLLPETYRHLKAVGRLDMASTGLLLFTNDNKLADSLLDPKNKIPKQYVVKVHGSPSPETIDSMLGGIKDKGEVLKASDITIKKLSKKESTLLMTLNEGKNREIRRLCELCGHEVISLKRISVGNIDLGTLEIGKVRVEDFESL